MHAARALLRPQSAPHYCLTPAALMMRTCPSFALLASAAAHSSLISPKPRNAIDSKDPRWQGGRSSPDLWQKDLGPVWGQACACKNGSSACDIGQTCLWMSVGCSLGCAECDGGTIDGKSVGTNPNGIDRCKSGKKPWTNNDPLTRTFNRNCTGPCIGTEHDFTKYNPWRAPGAAPTYDSCGRAGGGPHPTGGKGEYVNTSFAHFGQLGSTLPKQPSGALWKAGSVVETLWNVRANHGGGYQYRLCPLGSELTEACFHKTPMAFAGNSKLMMSNGSMLGLNSVFVSEGTLPANSTWQMMPIPMGHDYCGSNPGCTTAGHPFPPPCGEENDPCGASGKENGCKGLAQGLCSGEWMNNITIYDSLKVPEVTPGEYVLGFRWDCESTAQVWQSCADVTITK